MEKEDLDKLLPLASKEANVVTESTNHKGRGLRTMVNGIVALLCLSSLFTISYHRDSIERIARACHDRLSPAKGGGPTCPQVPALLPSAQSPAVSKLDEYFQSDKFRNISIDRLSGAVQVRTESFDDLGPIGEDKRWEVMYDFAAYLKETFPTAHETLQLEKINTHGLLFTWQGSDEKLKPTLLLSHQDVVPVPESTVDSWTHPPFSGFYDGKYIWGRGSWDCKSQLIGTLDAVEELIKAGFKPRRTLILSFGFDEEVGGPEGAGYLGKFLFERYSHDGIAAIVDEGASFIRQWGLHFALPGVGEKGHTDVNIVVRMPGGHSSIPSDHTSIGVISDLITLIENDKYSPVLDDANPFLGLLTCGAEHSPEFPSKIKRLLKHRQHHHHHHYSHRHGSSSDSTEKTTAPDRLAEEVAKKSLAVRYLMQTSIAVDVIEGGVKVNALPERTSVIVNHRINIGESIGTVQKKVSGLAETIAAKYNLSLHAFDGVAEAPSSISLSASSNNLAPAPVSPTDATVLSPWSILSGTTRALYGNDIVVAPGLMTGNTDTRHYWNLTKHIFRFTPGWDGEDEGSGLGNIHTVDERVSVKSHVNLVRWISLFVQNMDESELD